MTPFMTFAGIKRVRRRYEKGAPALRKGCAGAPHSEQNTTRPVFVCCAQTVQIEKPLPPARPPFDGVEAYDSPNSEAQIAWFK